MKYIKNIVFILVLCVFNMIVVDAAVKEKASNDFNGDTYVIGSTKFDDGYTVTATRAAKAGINEAYIQYEVFGNDLNTLDVKTYYYSDLNDEWYEIKNNGEGVKTLDSDEVQALEDNLNIFYINNVEKSLEFDFDGDIDEDSIYPHSFGVGGTAVVNNNKITVPASWILGFSYEKENGNLVNVNFGSIDEDFNLVEEEEPIAKVIPSLSFDLDEKLENGKTYEFDVNISANSYEGEEITLSSEIFADPNFYYKNGESWEKVPLLEKEFEYDDDTYGLTFNLTDKTIKFKYTPTMTSLDELSETKMIDFSLMYEENTSVSYGTSVEILKESVVAQVGFDYYDNLSAAINAASEYSGVKVLKDITLTSTVNITDVDDKVSIDLNGHNINAEAVAKGFTIYSPGINMSIINTSDTKGTISGGIVFDFGFDASVQTLIASGDKDADPMTLTIGQNVEIAGTNSYKVAILVKGSGSKTIVPTKYDKLVTVNVYGKLTGNVGIQGNGQAKYAGTLINIYDGAVIETNNLGMYLPQAGEVNIKGGSITSHTGIATKAGSINITGGTIHATGAKAVPVANNNGVEETGDVIFVEENTAYQDNVKINITGGTLTSDNGYIIQEYNPTNDIDLSLTVEGLYATKKKINDYLNYYVLTED